MRLAMLMATAITMLAASTATNNLKPMPILMLPN